MATRMQQRRGTAAQWISTNNGDGPILEAGEIGFESDTGKFKIGDGVNHWVDLNYFVDADTLVDGAPGLLNTLNELAAAIGDDPAFFTTVATNLSNHEADTTNVHGIANTAELATKTFAAELLTNATKSNITITGDKNGLTITAENGVADSTTDNLTEGTTNKYFTNQRALDATSAAYDAAGSAATAQQNAEDYADSLAINYDAAGAATSAVSTHNSATTNVHGILDTADLATQQYVNDAVSNAEVDQSTLAGIGIDWSGTQFDIDSTVVTLDDTQTLTNKTISTANNTITVEVADVSDLTATAAELNTLDGITADVNELNVLDGITSSTAELNILDGVTATASEINILDGATLTVAELNYVDGVTSSIQTQLDDKLSKTGGTMTGDITLAGMPTQALHAATKSYVDAVTEGLHIHASCVAATTSNVSISTDLEVGDVVDGVTLAEGDRVLVKAQTNAAQNGIYVVQASGAALRASDFNEPQEVDGGDFVFVTGGTLHDNTGWVQTTTNVVTIGTDPIVFTQFSGAGTYTAGTGLDLDGTVFSIDTATTVDVSTAQTLTNKTISAANNTLTIATTDLTDVTASAAELNILDGVTATALELNVLDGITASTTELNYVDGVTSAIQTQLDSKAPIASPTFTGTVSGITKSMVGLGNVDNTSDANKPVSTATQAALDLKANLAGPTFTGTVTIPNGAALGTPASVTLTNATGLPVSGITSSTSASLGLGAIELGHATDTTISRASAGRVAIEGVNIVTTSSTDTLTNKTLSSAVLTGTLTAGGGVGTSGQLLSSTATGVQWVNAPTGYSAPTIGSTSIASGATVTTISGLTLASPTVTGTLTLPNSIVTSSGTATVNSNSIAAVADTMPIDSFISAEYTVVLVQGTPGNQKVRTSKVIVQNNKNDVDSSEFAITETGGEIQGVSVTAVKAGSSVPGFTSELQIAATDAATRNVSVRFIKTVM